MTASTKNGNVQLLLIHAWTFISSLLLAVLLPKIFDEGEYIRVMQLLSLVSLITPIFSFAVPTYIMRHLNKLHGNELVKISLKLLLLGAALSIILLILFCINTGYLNEPSYLLCVSAICFLQAILLSYSALARMNGVTSLYFNTVALPKVLLFTVIIFIFYFEEIINYQLYLFIWLGSLLVTSLISIKKVNSLTKGLYKSECNKCDGVVKSFKEPFVFCYPIVLSNVLVVALPFLERFILPGQLDSTEVAMYIFNIDLIGKVTAVSILFLKVIVFPNILKMKIEVQCAKYHQYLRLVLILAASVFISMALLTSTFVRDIYVSMGYSIFFNSFVFKCVLFGSLLFSINYMFTIALAIVSDNAPLLKSTALTLSLHTFGILVVFKSSGVEGIAFSFVISMLLSSIYLGVIALRRLTKYEKNLCKI